MFPALPPEKLSTPLLEAQLAVLKGELELLQARETLILSTKEYIARLNAELQKRQEIKESP